MLLFFFLRGRATKKKQHISGKKQISPTLLKIQLHLKRKASPIKIGSMPLLKGIETQHILVTGGTGTGKTNSFHHILPQIRSQKTIILDPTGLFVEKYFDPYQDTLLNPFDPRTAPWHPWSECTTTFDYDTLAESLIPQTLSDHENYWRTAARTLLSTLIQKLSDTKRTSELSHWLLYQPLDKLAEFLEGTKAAAHIDIHSEKTAASIRSVAASYLTCLEHLPDTTTPFSIKTWIQDKTPGWLFLYTKPSERATLNPLLSSWFSTATRSLLSLTPDLQRRIWFVIDELPIFQKLQALDSLITEGRKYGACALLALQSPAQLEEIYGRAPSQTILGNCATRLIFAEHDPETAQKISRSLGETEIKEYQEGISYGAHQVRDGVNLSLQSKKAPLISSSQIQSLENNHAYLKLPGNTPITKFSLTLK